MAKCEACGEGVPVICERCAADVRDSGLDEGEARAKERIARLAEALKLAIHGLNAALSTDSEWWVAADEAAAKATDALKGQD